MEGFDFGFTPEGEIIVDPETHDIAKSVDDDLRIQLVFNRLKSISHDWFVDEIGADLEELIGKPCTADIAEYGKDKIIAQLTFDDLWNNEDIVVVAQIKDNTHILYKIYLRMYQSETEDTYSYEIETELDLVKGVFVRYGWGRRRRFKYLDYPMISNTLFSINVLNGILSNAHALLDGIKYITNNYGGSASMTTLTVKVKNCIDLINMLKFGYGTEQQYQGVVDYGPKIEEELQNVLDTIKNNSGGN